MLAKRVRLPRALAVTCRLARHELAYAVRNMYDGDLAHFHHVARRFGGFSSHHCHTVSSDGFAFNEGWACFSAGECVAHTAARRENVAGDVAHLLRELQRRCNTSDDGMVSVLQHNPATIYSFHAFQSAHARLHACS